jgi:anti-sigma B factor antagonist
MDIIEETRGGILILRPVGRIDSATAGAFESRIVQAVTAGPGAVVIDMAGLSYISSAGLRALLVAAKRARPAGGGTAGGGTAGGRIVLADMPAPIRDVFDMSGFSSLFDIHPTAADAVAGLS